MNRGYVGSAEWFSEEWRRWFRRIAVAVIQGAAFGISVLIHYGMRLGIERVIPKDWEYLMGFLHGTLGLVFSAIYLAIAIDTLVIFIPAFEGLKSLIDGNGWNGKTTVD